MKRIIVFFFSLIFVGLAPNLRQSLRAQEDAPKQPTIKLQVQPAPAPLPALRYRLLPELRDKEPGNAALRYYRAFAPEWVNHQNPEFQKALAEWQQNPDKLPPKLLDFRGGPLQEIELGARRTYCDWDMVRQLRKEGIAMLLPDVQGFRNFSHLLAARARLRMSEGKHDEALHTLQTGFAFSRHVGDGPTLIQSLVGMAMTHQMLRETEHFVQQKDAPNLYWALTDLPRPFVDLRQPLQGEKIMLDNLFPGVREMAYDKNIKPMSQHELAALQTKIRYVGDLVGGPGGKDNWLDRVGLAVMAARVYPEAKRFLLKQGIPEKVVDEMPVAQVALIYEIYTYDMFYDDMTKWYGQPYPVMQARTREVVETLGTSRQMPGHLLAGLLLPAVERVFEAGYRLDRKIAALRCVEAVRLYAAEHGNLPAKLDDIKEVPIPLDLMTGEPFAYSLEGNTATLTAPPPPGQSEADARIRQTTWTYEISLKR